MSNKHKTSGINMKKFPPLFWVVFIALIIFNVSVFFDYSKPIERYARFAKANHLITIKEGAMLYQVDRHEQQLEKCKVIGSGLLQWLSADDEQATYQFKTSADASASNASDAPNCMAGDKIKVNYTNDETANTLLVLLSIDFADPFKGVNVGQ
ncbi:MAG: hypothetical protein ACI9FJ_002633 [Alteromonadaceae bacterium]|jgi:hypothetical protein